MLSVVRLVSFWRCTPVQYNCQKSSNFQGLSHFSRIFGKNDKIPGFFQAGKTVTIFPGFPGAVGTLYIIGPSIRTSNDSTRNSCWEISLNFPSAVQPAKMLCFLKKSIPNMHGLVKFLQTTKSVL